MSKKTTVATNLVGRQVTLAPENAKAAKNYTEKVYPADRPPWVKLYPDGGEVVAVYQDSDRALMLAVSTPTGLVNIGADWVRVFGSSKQ